MHGSIVPPAASGSAIPLDRLVADLADRQHGVVHIAQLRALGLGRGAIEHRIRTGRLHRVHFGVYAVGHRQLTLLGLYMAATLSCGGWLSHRSAGQHLGLRRTAATRVDIAITGRAGRRQPGIAIHRPLWLPDDEVTVIDAVPVTTAERTLLDLAEVVARRELERACDDAERARLVDWAEVLRLVERHPAKLGAHRMRRLLALHIVTGEREDSALAERFARFCRRHRLPAPDARQVIAGHEVDFSWPSHRLVVETDGWEFHRTRLRFEDDRRRDAALLAAGWRVLRLTWARLDEEPRQVAAELRALLRAAGRLTHDSHG